MQSPRKRPASDEETGAIYCPHCGSDALYRYGLTVRGQQRYLCLVCDRQFSRSSLRRTIPNRPVCPHCQRPMHVYKREAGIIRFRCANYPTCKKFQKITTDQEE